MNQSHTLIFAKKFRLPSPAANIIQTLNMAWGFQSAGASVHLIPGLSQEETPSLLQNIEEEYRLDKDSRPNLMFIPARHKGIYGALFRFFIFKKWLANPDAIFFSRDVNETLFILNLRKFFPKKQKIIYEMHDSVFLEHREYGQSDAHSYEKKEKKILSHVDGIVYTGTYLKKKIQELYPIFTPSLVAVPGFNKDIFSPLSYRIPTDTITLGYFGSLHPGKGVSLLIDTFKKLPGHFRLRIVGGNPERKYVDLQERVRNEIRDPNRIEFTGQVSPARVRDHLAGCHILVIPFVSEVEFLSPIKLYEALGMGLPVVATPVPAIRSAAAELPYVATSAGLRPEDLTKTIQNIGHNPNELKRLRDMAVSARRDQDWSSRAERIFSFARSL